MRPSLQAGGPCRAARPERRETPTRPVEVSGRRGLVTARRPSALLREAVRVLARLRLAAALVLLLVSGTASAAPAAAVGRLLDFTAQEREAIARHGPWPPPAIADPGNVLDGRPQAIALGLELFFDARLSPSGQVACASCHVPGQAFTDGRARSMGLEPVDRNAPSLWNAVGERWHGWGGASDSLWSQALKALLDPREMASGAAHVQQRLRQEPRYACRVARLRAELPVESPLRETGDEADLVLAGQALAAFVATLHSPRSPFDRFRDALLRGDRRAAARYPLAAQRGLKLFVGRGQCMLCHGGPRFSNGEFADTGLPFFSRPGVVDPGRYAGIEALRASPYHLLSRWAWTPDPAVATKTRHVHLQHRNFGEFKVPSLRHVAHTAPYMHDGQLATLADVLRHYSELNEERLHADGERLLRPTTLDAGEAADLEAFLRSLGDARAPAWRMPARLADCR